MRAFLTGATGYIGSHLARSLLERGAAVASLVRGTPSKTFGDMQCYLHDGSPKSIVAAISDFRPSIVFHLAAAATTQDNIESISGTITANTTLGSYVLEAASAAGCRYFVNTGTYWQYGEDGCGTPNTLYAACKLAFEPILKFYAHRHSLSTVSLVLYDVYGPADRRRKFLPALIRAAIEGQVVMATGGEQLVDFVHIDDVCRGYVQAAELLEQQSVPGHGSFGLDSGYRPTLREAVQQLESIVGRGLVEWGRVPYPKHQIFKPVTLDRLPGWEPRLTLSAGLRALVEEELQRR